jgi:hypothetical protein
LSGEISNQPYDRFKKKALALRLAICLRSISTMLQWS